MFQQKISQGSLIKIILAVLVLVSVGAVLGVAGYLISNKLQVNLPVVSESCENLNEEKCIKNPKCEPKYIYPIVGGKQYVACNEKDTEPVAKQVIVTTDKTEYEQGETVKITVKNNIGVPIWYAKEVECGASFWLLENCKGEEMLYDLICLWDYYQHGFTKFEQGEILNGKWEGMFLNQEYKLEVAKPGCYRIVFPYSKKEKKPTDEGWERDMIKIYSNEFTIKEKTAQNNLSINLDGYVETCISNPVIYIDENGTWRKANADLPDKGMYFLDGKYYGYGMCDIVTCNKIENPYIIKLVEYIEVGKKESLETKGYLVPDYETLQLSGRIKVELGYFTDNKCSDKKRFSRIIEKPAIDPRCGQKVIGKSPNSSDHTICPAMYIGYEFDSLAKKCVQKIVGGCSYETPFNSLEECQKVCEIRSVPAGNELMFETIEKRDYSSNEEVKNYVINNISEWKNLLRKLTLGDDLPKEYIPVDFTKDMIIAVFQGTKNTGGYSTEITNILETKSNLEIYIKEVSPGSNCMVTEAFTSPYHIVKFQKFAKEVVFKTEKEVTNCQ